MTRIALVGTGAVGCVVAASLLRGARHALTLCARTAFTALHVDTPAGTLARRVEVHTRPEDVAVVDHVLVATKTYDAAATARWFPALVGTRTRVAVLQNGVEHRARFAPWIDPEAIIPVVVELPCERRAPGHARLRRAGSLTMPATDDGRAFAALFDDPEIDARTVEDFDAACWRKLCFNAVGALSALTLRPSGVLRDEAIGDVARALVRECVAVARAEGVALDEGLPEEVLRRSRGGDPDSFNSLAADRRAGRPMEVDARHGVVVRLGARHGIETPHHRMVAALLGACAAG